MKACLARRLCLSVCVIAAVVVGRFAGADDLRPSWECLPDNTVMMIRVPQPAAFLETIRTRTKFGAVALGDDRLGKAWELILEVAGKGDDAVSIADMQKEMAKYGFEAKDLEAAFAGDMGMGIVFEKRKDGLPPLTMLLAWMEPGAEPAERMVAALQKVIEEQAGDEAAPQRIDVEMAGHDVMWITWPILRADLGDVKLKGGVEGDDPERLEELRKELEQLTERARQAPKVVVGKQHFFLARAGGRLLVGQTLPQPPNVRMGVKPAAGGLALEMGAEAQVEADEDPDRTSRTDEARGIFERYLAAHAAGDAAPLADVLQAPGMRAALPGGECLVDVIFDPRRLLAADDEEHPEVARRLAAVGLRDLGPVAMRVSFDEGRLRQGMFVTLPAPRAGLMRILEQDGDAADVPSFVTSEAVAFTQISLDLAEAYRTLKEFATAEFGDQAANAFRMAEEQGRGWLGMELEAMLANLGSRHMIVTYAPQIAAAIEEARKNREAGEARAAPAADRMAIVWKLADDGPVNALLPKIAALAQAQVVEEQGFRGVRLPGPASVFVGQGHLVVGIGGDALEKTLAGIRNPPAGAASLRESDVPRRGDEMVGFGPSRMFSVGDATRTGGSFGELRDLVTSMVPDDVEEEYRDVLAKVQALVPSAEDMQGMLGVGASIMEVNDAGIAIRSAWEMPAP